MARIYEFHGGEEVATIDLKTPLQAERDMAQIAELRHLFEIALVKDRAIYNEIMDLETIVDGVRTVNGFVAGTRNQAYL